MPKPTAEHLTRRACRVSTIQEARSRRDREAKDARAAAERDQVYADGYHANVEEALRTAAWHGATTARLWIPITLQQHFRRHMHELGLGTDKTGRDRTQPAPVKYPIVSGLQYEFMVTWGPQPIDEHTVD